MKRIISLFLVTFLLFFALLVAYAETDIAVDREAYQAIMDELTTAEKTLLKSMVSISIAQKSAGTEASHYQRCFDVDLMDLSIDDLTWILNYLNVNITFDEFRSKDGLAGAVICDFNGLSITVTDYEIKENWRGQTELALYCDVVNNDNVKYYICLSGAAINDWQVDEICSVDIYANKKAKAEIDLIISPIGVYEMDEIETVSFFFLIECNNRYYFPDELVLNLK